jgi:multidrug transporter EmrE-like cation transporter
LKTATPEQSRRAVMLVFLVTIIGAAAQVLIKSGASTLNHPSLIETGIAILTNPKLFIGYSMYGMSMILMVLALRHGDLSAVYPVMALTFVWVTILSVAVFHESLNLSKIAGIGLIVAGVATFGRISRA